MENTSAFNNSFESLKEYHNGTGDDYDTELIDQAKYESFNITSGSLLIVLAISGTVGNVISTIIFWKPSMTTHHIGMVQESRKTRCFLYTGVAVFDTTFLLLMASTKGLPLIVDYRKLLEEVFMGISDIMYTISILLVILLKFERYIMTCHIHMHGSLFYNTRRILWISFIILISVVIHIPLIMSNHRDNYLLYASLHLIRFLFAFISMIIFHILIIKEVRDTSLIINGSNETQNREIRIGLTTTSFFFCCNILQILSSFLEAGETQLQAISEIMLTLNCCLNMIVGPSFGEKFKETFLNNFVPATIKTKY